MKRYNVLEVINSKKKWIDICFKMLTDEEILKLYNTPSFDGSFSGARVFRDFLYAEKNELIPLSRIYEILKQESI